ncbi:hypothetical protein ASPZODRAFT_1298457 [Penicilliopsis zonata CBS 506.65]|uniref:Uncharacterized protein n=1 Tax=Penicilliopsis zonata CBS 506.65 TaxID=1073090 RepID=A0A1L9S6E1_9EURO|nr:hypothetical protein ASPZODRAFT_1298457 [Penicilliopsis zonata CBS 506.65]OJJ42736.1 hypothetical protein ASPZODRAFT_1298457 [Penicilliopsis zonata CBS 506.65]
MSAFFLDSPIPPKLDLAGARSQLFQTPQKTPSASTSLYRSISTSRKRTRYNDSEKYFAADSPVGGDFASPAPLVNTDYRLAGGCETTTTAHTLAHLRDTAAELDYRPNRYRETAAPLDGSVDSLTSLDVGSRKRTRRESVLPAHSLDQDYNDDYSDDEHKTGVSWPRAVINVVGKVWDFCWSGAFRGFYAGGGQGYHWEEHSSTTSTEKPRYAAAYPPVYPGGSTRYSPPGRYPDEIERNWVVVAEKGDKSASPTGSVFTKRVQPHRKNASSVSSTRRRSAVMPRLGKKGFASPGRPASPTKQPVEVTTDAQRAAAKMRRLEREEDASLARLNAQLQAMIREGREALGTRIEVDDGNDGLNDGLDWMED